MDKDLRDTHATARDNVTNVTCHACHVCRSKKSDIYVTACLDNWNYVTAATDWMESFSRNGGSMGLKLLSLILESKTPIPNPLRANAKQFEPGGLTA